MIVRKIKNISSASVPIEVDSNTIIYLEPNGIIENTSVNNLEGIREFVKVEYNLSEVPVNEKKTLLFD